MSVIRRVYLYSVAFVSFVAMTAALARLLELWYVRAFLRSEASDSVLAVAAFPIAVAFTAGVVWAVHWGWAQRAADRRRDDRVALPRRLYLSGIMVVALAQVAIAAVALLHGLLVGGLAGAPGFAVASLVVWGAALLGHRRMEEEERGAPKPSRNGPQQAYLYLALGGGMVMLLVGVGLTLGEILRWSLLSGVLMDSNAPALWDGWLRHGLALSIVGLLLWAPLWVRALQDRSSAPLRVAYLYAMASSGALALLVGLGFALSTLTAAMFSINGRAGAAAASGVLSVLALLAPIALVGAAAWWFHHWRVMREMAGGSWQVWRARRVYQYLMAGVGLAAFMVGLWGMTTLALTALAAIESVSGLPWLVWGGGAAGALAPGAVWWAVAWRRCQPVERDLRKREAGLATRRGYLFIALSVSMALTAAGLITFLTGLLRAQASGGLTLGTVGLLSGELAAVLTGGFIAVRHARYLRVDYTLAPEELPLGAQVTVLVPEGDTPLVDRVCRALGGPVRVLHAGGPTGPGASLTEEQLDRVVRTVRDGPARKYLVVLVGRWPEVHAYW